MIGKPVRHAGFTLMEMLVVIVIIAALAVLMMAGTRRLIENGRKVKCLAQFRDFQVGMALFEGDYQKPPVPENKKTYGWDVIYGNPNGLYQNSFLVSVLAGEDKNYPYSGENFSSTQTNPRNEAYITFPYSADKRGGVGDDGNLYDPWGAQIMVAVNTMQSSQSGDLADFNEGLNDRRLHTWGWAEYQETKPFEQAYVFWSYGKDRQKGDAMLGKRYWEPAPYAGSDDVISW
jgi:prepilin-type N-terminal cleavage/methylation domain-containing protein